MQGNFYLHSAGVSFCPFVSTILLSFPVFGNSRLGTAATTTFLWSVFQVGLSECGLSGIGANRLDSA
jgi:hypothetical protein